MNPQMCAFEGQYTYGMDFINQKIKSKMLPFKELVQFAFF